MQTRSNSTPLCISLMTTVALAGGLLVGPSIAHAQTDNDALVTVAVRYQDLDLDRPEDAARMLTRLGRAAEEACGAPFGSSPQYQKAVRGSPCYRHAMERAVQGSDARQLVVQFEALRATHVVSN